MLIAVLALTQDDVQVRALYLLTFPWLLLIVLVFNLPFLSSMFRQFQMPEATKVNHALEHGTIFFLRRRYIGKFWIGGRAQADGFRLNGIPSSEFIIPAFTELRECLARGDSRPVVSKSCGSNIVTAQGYAIVLMTLSAPFLVFLQLSLIVRVAILAANLAAYLLLRKQLGNWIQRHWFMSLDFEDAAVRYVNQVKPVGSERPPAFFVRTVVRRVDRSADKPNHPLQPTAGGACERESRGPTPAAAERER